MSSADVLQRLLKLDLSTPESRRVLDNFFHFQGYGYFVSTLEDSDVFGFVNFLDKVREVSSLCRKKTLIGGIPGLGRDSGLRTTLAGMPGCSSADMRGSSRSSNNTRVASRTGQKQEGFSHHQRYR